MNQRHAHATHRQGAQPFASHATFNRNKTPRARSSVTQQTAKTGRGGRAAATHSAAGPTNNHPHGHRGAAATPKQTTHATQLESLLRTGGERGAERPALGAGQALSRQQAEDLRNRDDAALVGCQNTRVDACGRAGANRWKERATGKATHSRLGHRCPNVPAWPPSMPVRRTHDTPGPHYGADPEG